MKMGFDFNWQLEISTCEPKYYYHTQRMFYDLYKLELAYKKDAYVNWDPVD
jgi:leucyl-tRNA synthetase